MATILFSKGSRVERDWEEERLFNGRHLMLGLVLDGKGSRVEKLEWYGGTGFGWQKKQGENARRKRIRIMEKHLK